MKYLDEYSDDEIDDLFELYEEARDLVDALVPRGDRQAALASIVWDIWNPAHDFYFHLAAHTREETTLGYTWSNNSVARRLKT